LVFALVSVAGCVSSHLRMQVRVARDANQDRPIPVDVVFVWDGDLDAKIAELPARDWFQLKAQFQRDDPDGRALAVHEWEWVPGQAVPPIDLQVPASRWRRLRGTYVFANYPSDAPHRIRLTVGTPAVVELLRDGVRLQGPGPTTATR
jgi:type VI secretion system protein